MYCLDHNYYLRVKSHLVKIMSSDVLYEPSLKRIPLSPLKN